MFRKAFSHRNSVERIWQLPLILKPLLDLYSTNDIISSKISINKMILILKYIVLVNFPFLDEDVPRPFLWCIYFAAYSLYESNVSNFNNRNHFRLLRY